MATKLLTRVKHVPIVESFLTSLSSLSCRYYCLVVGVKGVSLASIGSSSEYSESSRGSSPPILRKTKLSDVTLPQVCDFALPEC